MRETDGVQMQTAHYWWAVSKRAAEKVLTLGHGFLETTVEPAFEPSGLVTMGQSASGRLIQLRCGRAIIRLKSICIFLF